MTYHKTLNDKLSAMEQALKNIAEMVGEAERDHSGRLSKDQRLAILQWCLHGLGIDHVHTSKYKETMKDPDDAA